ncbi:unnamed protein product [Vicia faba]|uniref:Reverse transcriptase n=1 Tax=Vicia faba TaxID=3906 RepID=A0AAV0ZSQ4_VICFA|nr:unnamed protein product [Vicia faba]
MLNDTIPSLVDDNMNIVITRLTSLDEISAAVSALNKDSASGPDSFGAVFFQTYWDIVKQDVSNVVLDFFFFNLDGSCMVISNFKFKIILKIISDMIASIMPFLVSREQRGFIHARHIHDCIGWASEVFNLLDAKTWCGNLALRMDIWKDFDTLNWEFL